MPLSLRKLRKGFARRAVVLDLAGRRSQSDAAASWFGRVQLALPGEGWPESKDGPMHALCQINLTELPFRPPALKGLELVTVFIGPEELPIDAANGTNWALRAYPRLGKLAPLERVDTESPIKPQPLRPRVVERDYPCYDDVVETLPEELFDDFDYDEFDELFPNAEGFKLGGWPTLIQSEIEWGPRKVRAAKPEFAFQIATTEKGNWMWGDNGTGYFGRGTAAGRKGEWALSWQCF